MKKLILLFTSLFILTTGVFAQANNTVDVTDDVYELLRYAEIKGLCSNLSTVRPYTQKYIIQKLNETIENLEKNEASANEVKIVQNAIDKFQIKDGTDYLRASVKFHNNSEKVPLSLIIKDNIKGEFSSGFYDESKSNSWGYELHNDISFFGDLGNNVSYRNTTMLGATYMPLEDLGTYDIGKWWYHDFGTQSAKIIKKSRNNSYLPYQYTKYWDGQCYFFSNISASGLEGWARTNALAFGMLGEIHGTFLNDKVDVAINRNYREWAAMDNGSSLVLNAKARPFIALETRIQPFDWIAISSLTGVLEHPNRDDILENAYYKIDADGKMTEHVEDSYFFENAFALTMVDLNLKYFHFDFGSSCIFPKRFELGYMFPLIDRVVYQNNVGDYDNLALFGDFKFQYPGLGSMWLSGYLDEVNVFKTKFWEKTRAMFAVQAGAKVVIPGLPFTTASFRYTKVEPYCYTHHSINYVPYYDHYISESYTNNGESLGYYLLPNSDEFHLQVESRAIEYATISLTYQLIRHGVDWGSRAGIGNNTYSELQTKDRSSLTKYFLKDGVYEWSNIVSISGSYDFRKFNIPVKLYGTAGFIYDWFTDINGTPGSDASFHYINTDEYYDRMGFVVTIGCSIFN